MLLILLLFHLSEWLHCWFFCAFKLLRRSAGFVLADGMHHNIRTTVEPDPEDGELLNLPFPFAKGCLAAVF
jgi:hypothetical protein